MSITVKNITKLYGHQKAVDSASFHIESGEVVGLLGPNGAGKSTLMKILTCFIPPSEGEASVCDLNVLEKTLEVRSKIGYLAENNPLYLDMYVHEFLMFIASVHKLSDRKKSVMKMIELTGLGIEQKKKIGQLSKGYRQRVGLAQALIHNPEVLILDEPTSGLDPNQIIEIRNLISEIGKEKTILLSTHIMQEVEAICSRAIIIDLGKIIADDSLINLKKRSKSNIITVEFDKKVGQNVLLKIQGVVACWSEDHVTWKIESNEQTDVRKEIFRFAVENDLSVLSMEKEKSSIEDLFRRLTKK
jgi:ABC-2 type transport system ATP-binding protein